ncbi:phosphoenolpyruvate carboxykinase (ATP) [Sphingobacterium sp. LRF_L2]|uniref:phosphoenolpyruvate carboxykinase (ATP) n=1 Tax=Sphingobacterium sp. LRF_L2 TaxID=3369421 RepID=UPI003F5E9D74
MAMELEYPNPLNIAAPLSKMAKQIYLNLDADKLVEQTTSRGQGQLSDAGALCIKTGKFTGRSPQDRFIVQDEFTSKHVDWGDVNIPISEQIFDNLLEKMRLFIADKEIWMRHCRAGADPSIAIDITVINTTPWANLFCHHLFIRPTKDELNKHEQGWVILQAPEFLADPSVDGTRQENFSIINFTKKMILIGGTAYTGEMKKAIFSVLNLILPYKHGILPMHCSANEGIDGDTALFFGLSGTGKTTLSADSDRKLIGDDEHGWSDNLIFNFEGGCYAKCIDLTEEKEPEIFAAIRRPALLENVSFYPLSNSVNYADVSLTENTRVAYPIHHINNAKERSIGRIPSHIFFLTCDAFGILPPISKLTNAQAMYHYLSGYTAKVAGTEIGIREPQTTFSACFGRVFLPLSPTHYADMLGDKLTQNPDTKVWLVNTGWTGGAYGIGKRISLQHTRTIVKAALAGALNNVEFEADPIFGILIPKSCPQVPSEILFPRNTWSNKEEYDKQANNLATLFINNFKQYQSKASSEIKSASPKLTAILA